MYMYKSCSSQRPIVRLVTELPQIDQKAVCGQLYREISCNNLLLPIYNVDPTPASYM
jgi:hypothetical protein